MVVMAKCLQGSRSGNYGSATLYAQDKFTVREFLRGGAERSIPANPIGKQWRFDPGLSLGSCVGIIANMPAELITRFKNVNPDGSILELVVWRVPEPVPPTEHGYKYRAVYIQQGLRVVGFDNERGKGDHCHLDGQELPYRFVSVEQLVEDFIAAVSSRRSK
jgi:hypothetical protein